MKKVISTFMVALVSGLTMLATVRNTDYLKMTLTFGKIVRAENTSRKHTPNQYFTPF